MCIRDRNKPGLLGFLFVCLFVCFGAMAFLLKIQNEKGRKSENVRQVWILTRHFWQAEPHTICSCRTVDLDSSKKMKKAKVGRGGRFPGMTDLDPSKKMKKGKVGEGGTFSWNDRFGFVQKDEKGYSRGGGDVFVEWHLYSSKKMKKAKVGRGRRFPGMTEQLLIVVVEQRNVITKSILLPKSCRNRFNAIFSDHQRNCRCRLLAFKLEKYTLLFPLNNLYADSSLGLSFLGLLEPSSDKWLCVHHSKMTSYIKMTSRPHLMHRIWSHDFSPLRFLSISMFLLSETFYNLFNE